MWTNRSLARVIGTFRVEQALLAVISISSIAAAGSSGVVACRGESSGPRSGYLATEPLVQRLAVRPLQRSFSLIGHAPHPISLVEVLYEATRTLDPESSTLKLIENSYEEFYAQWKLNVHPRIERLVTLSVANEQDRLGTARDLDRDSRARALKERLKETWDLADSLHEALIARIIDTCASMSVSGESQKEYADNVVAQANFRGRVAHRVAFADGESFLIDRLPLVTTPCVDLAIALAHPRVIERVPVERREALAVLLSTEWPRILREHHTLREIGFSFAGAELEAIAVDDAASPHASIRATEHALQAIAELARENLSANLAFADRLEREIGVDAADALRVELISNACRDGGFATAIAEPWQRVERALRRLAREHGAASDGAEMRALREQRHQFVLGCVTEFRRFLAEPRAFSADFESTHTGERASAALLRGEHPNTEELVGRFERAAQVLPVSLRSNDDEPRESAVHSEEHVSAGYNVTEEDAADIGRSGSLTQPLMLHELHAAQGDDSEDAEDDASSESVTFESHDVRRVVAALALEGITKPPIEVAALLDALLASDPVVRETLARRTQIPAYPRFAIAPTLARDMPEVIAREEAFDSARATMLEAACEMPIRGVGRAVLELERLTHLIFQGDPVFGREFPDSIFECATRAGLDRDAQRALMQHAQPQLQALFREAGNLAQEARAAALRDTAKEERFRANAEQASGEEESPMDRILRGGEVDDEINAFITRTHRRMIEIILTASGALAESQAEQVHAIKRFQVFWIDRVCWLSMRSTVRTLESIEILRELAQSKDPNSQGVLACLDACEVLVLDEALDATLNQALDQVIDQVRDQVLEVIPASVVSPSSPTDDTHAAWTRFWTTLETHGEIKIEASQPPISGFVEGHHMRLLLEAVANAPNEQRLQRMIARRYEYVLGRLRQTPFADVFHP